MKQVKCDRCNGTGFIEVCELCGGSGQVFDTECKETTVIGGQGAFTLRLKPCPNGCASKVITFVQTPVV